MSNNYSLTERKLAAFFRKYPNIKKTIKRNYQYLNYLIHRGKEKVVSKYDIIEVSYLEGYETFFGYYDKSPMNIDETMILFQATNFPTTKKPNPNKKIKIVIKDMNDSVIFEDETSSYNWQQGCKLMWIDQNKIIYNIYDSNEKLYKSKIVDVLTEETKTINYPIYDATNNFALTLNYDTLNKLRPDYGYQEFDSRFNELAYDKDGVFYIDFKKNNSELLISISDLCKISNKKSMQGAKHKVNHIMISPEKDKFIFLHRWFEGERKYDRLLCYNFTSKEIKVLLDDEMVSHCFWKNNDEIVVFANTSEHGDRYYNINLLSNDEIEIMNFKGANTLGDGHPNVFDGKEMLIDTYPDRARMKSLYLVNLETLEISKIASAFESFKFKGETRCDLHPRWSPKGNFIFIDSVHDDNKRTLYLINKKK